MSADSLRIVLRHELFHYAARARDRGRCAALAHRGRGRLRGPPVRPAARPTAGGRARRAADRRRPRHARARSGRWPTTGRGGSAASSQTGTGREALRQLYLAACGLGHVDIDTAIRIRAARRHRPRYWPRGARGWPDSLTAMARVLLVTNDFPPRRGGIQSYLENLVDELVAGGEHTLTVYAPKWKGARRVRRRRQGDRLRRGAPPDDADGAGAVGRAPDAQAHRPRRHRHRLVRCRGAAGAALRARPRRGGASGDRQHARSRGGLVDAAVGSNGVAPHRQRHRRRHVHQQLHAEPVRIGVRAQRGARAPRPRSRHGPVRARLGGPRRTAGHATGSASAPSSCACRGWCPARVRTC